MNPYFSTSQISNLTLTDTMTDTSIPITMPFARPLEQVFESNMELSTTVLLQSSESASVIPYGISDEQLENWTPEEYGPFPLAILSEKSFEDGKSSRVAAFGSAVSLSDSLLSSGSFCNSDYYLSVLNTLTIGRISSPSSQNIGRTGVGTEHRTGVSHWKRVYDCSSNRYPVLWALPLAQEKKCLMAEKRKGRDADEKAEDGSCWAVWRW